MKYCSNCGKEVNENAAVCLNCGCAVNGAMKPIREEKEGSTGCLWGVLGFFIPLVGLILFLIWRDTKPKAAKSAGIGGLIGVTWVIALPVILTIITMAPLL